MSFNVGPSYVVCSTSSSSLSSNSDDELDLNQALEAQTQVINAQQTALLNIYANNNLLTTYCLNEVHNDEPIHGSSIYGHRVIYWGRADAERNLWNAYFVENPRFNESMFRKRFRMGRSLFLRIVNAVKGHDNYFTQRTDGVSRVGLSSLQKITDVFRMLAYGVLADSTDECIKIGESTAIESMKRFYRAVVEVFSERYLRSPNTNDIERLLHIGEKRGFLGMLGSLDYMHWTWKNYPMAWSGQYSGRNGKPTIILEAVADYDLWIWHAYFGLPGSNNDINVLEASNLFSNLTKGVTHPAHYVIQGKKYNTGYYLTDGIYPKWSTLVQTVYDPRGPKKQLFAMKQERCRKDVHLEFSNHGAIVKGPA